MGFETVPAGVPLTEISSAVPVKTGCETVSAGVKFPVEVSELPVNFSSAPVPVKVGCEAVLVLTPVAMVWLVKLGSVTAVGLFAVKLPALQLSVRFSSATLVVSTGRVHDAAVPAVTDPPPVALPATYLLAVFSSIVSSGAETVPAGV